MESFFSPSLPASPPTASHAPCAATAKSGSRAARRDPPPDPLPEDFYSDNIGSGDDDGASDWRPSRGPSGGSYDSRGSGEGSDWTSARGTNSIYDSGSTAVAAASTGGGGGRSPVKVVRPLKPLLGGVSPLSADSSWVMGSRSWSFASPAGHVHDTAARSMATVGSPFSDSFSEDEDEEDSRHGARGRGGGRGRSGSSGGSGGGGSDRKRRQGGEASEISHSRMSSPVREHRGWTGLWLGLLE